MANSGLLYLKKCQILHGPMCCIKEHSDSLIHYRNSAYLSSDLRKEALKIFTLPFRTFIFCRIHRLASIFNFASSRTNGKRAASSGDGGVS